MSGPVRPMRLRHANGSVGTQATKIAVNRGVGQYILISNTHATQDLSVSFDGGANSFTILATTAPISINALFHYIYVTGSGASTTYEILIGEG